MRTIDREKGFSFIEALIALAILLGAMAIAFMFFIDFGEAISTESSTLATQQAGRVVIDEITRSVRQVGFGIRRSDEYNASTWQRAVIYGGSHVLAFNADIDPDIGGLPFSQSIAFPTGAGYTGEAIGAITLGAETYVYTIDADGNNAIETADRRDAATGSFNPAAETPNPMDFALFRRVYGFNGTDYGGSLEPLAPYLFTNGTSDITYPADGTSPDPLFTYWLTEDLNRDGVVSPRECVNDVVDNCPPSTPRSPLLYIWGDTDMDGTLSESEKTALRSIEVGSAAWSRNVAADGGAYKTTTLAADIDPDAPDAYDVKMTDASKLGPGYHLRIGTGSSAEMFVTDQVVLTTTPHSVLLSTSPEKVHSAGDAVAVLPSTALRAIRTIGITYTSITDKKDSEGDMKAIGRAGRVGTRGLGFRVNTFHRKVEVINAATGALSNDDSPTGADICPLRIVNLCSVSPNELSILYTTPPQQQGISFLVTDVMGNAIPEVEVTFSHSDGSIGALSKTAADSSGAGVATIGYTPTGVLGSDTIEAKVTCLDDSGVSHDSTATKVIDTYEVVTSADYDCLTTVSSRTPGPLSDVTVQVASASGPVSGHSVAFDLEFDPTHLPASPDFISLVGEFFLDGTSMGTTGNDGRLDNIETTTDADGRIFGSVGLAADLAGKGAAIKLSTRAPGDACGGNDADVEDTIQFFRLELDSTVPYPGCSELVPCTIGAASAAPKVVAELTLNDKPIPSASLLFINSDINPPTDGTETGASILLPGPNGQTDTNGEVMRIVANNGASVITPATPLKTLVDVEGSDIPSMCENTRIISASPQAGFVFEAPTNLCQASLRQAFVVKDSDDKICFNILNDAEAEGCPMEVKGVQITIYEADGVTPDSTNKSLIKIMEGGGVGSSASCGTSNKVKLFEDKCRIPKAKLPNGEAWIFTDYDSCSEPYLTVDPQDFFWIPKIQTEDKYPSGHAMDVTVFYECLGDCATGTTDSASFSLVTP